MEKEDYLSILWFQEQPIVIYVIDNKQIGCRLDYGGSDCGDSLPAFNMLKKMYDSSATQEAMPQRLERFFKDQTYLKLHDNFEHLLGFKDITPFSPYLSSELTITKNKQFPV